MRCPGDGHNTDGLRIAESSRLERLLIAMAALARREGDAELLPAALSAARIRILARDTGEHFELRVAREPRCGELTRIINTSRGDGEAVVAEDDPHDAGVPTCSITLRTADVLEAVAAGRLESDALRRLAVRSRASSSVVRQRRVEVTAGDAALLIDVVAPLARAARCVQAANAATLAGRCPVHCGYWRSALRQRAGERCAPIWSAFWISLFLLFEAIAAGSAIAIIALCSVGSSDGTAGSSSAATEAFCLRFRVAPAIGQLVFVALGFIFFPISLCCPERCCAPRDWFELPTPPGELKAATPDMSKGAVESTQQQQQQVPVRVE